MATPARSRAARARAAATAGRLTALAPRPVARRTGAAGRSPHHQRTIRSSVVAARSPGSAGWSPGRAHSGSGQPQPVGLAGSGRAPGTTGQCRWTAATASPVRSGWSVGWVRSGQAAGALPRVRRDRSLRRLPRISRMSARSFPLNAEGHHTGRASLHRAYKLAHHIPGLRQGAPRGAVRGTRRRTATPGTYRIRACRTGDSCRLRRGRMGRGRCRLGRPGRLPGSLKVPACPRSTPSRCSYPARPL